MVARSTSRTPQMADAPVTVGVDVGGTRTKVTALDGADAVLADRTVPTPADLRLRFGEVVGGLVRAVAAEVGGAGACGVVVPGIVDEAAGVGRYAANLGWCDLPIRDLTSAATGLVTAVGHDVRAGLLAEARFGAARGADHVMFLPIGTGIAGALMVDGRVLSGSGWAGEIGHAVVEPGGPECGCGARGCLEAIASATAVARAYAVQSGDVTGVTAQDVADRVVSGADPVATAVWGRAVAAVATAVSIVAAATGVRLVVVGGGLSNAREVLLEPLRAGLEARASVVVAPSIVRAELGDRAGSIGAALLARAALQQPGSAR